MSQVVFHVSDSLHINLFLLKLSEFPILLRECLDYFLMFSLCAIFMDAVIKLISPSSSIFSVLYTGNSADK